MDRRRERERQVCKQSHVNTTTKTPSVCFLLTLVVLTLLPVLQDQPVRSGRTLHSSPSIHGCIWHHHFWATMEAAEAQKEQRVSEWIRRCDEEHCNNGEEKTTIRCLQQRRNIHCRWHRCRTQGPRAESGPPHRFTWPLAALKTRDHLFLKKLKTNITCFYFEGWGSNVFML